MADQWGRKIDNDYCKWIYLRYINNGNVYLRATNGVITETWSVSRTKTLTLSVMTQALYIHIEYIKMEEKYISFSYPYFKRNRTRNKKMLWNDGLRGRDQQMREIWLYRGERTCSRSCRIPT